MVSEAQSHTLNIINYIQDEELRNKLISVNYHLIKACNYRCKFCFAHFNQITSNYLSEDKSKNLIQILAQNGTEKITFVGGEPTLVPFLPELVKFAKSMGMTTMIVTNGTKLSEEYLESFEGALDWVGLSIDTGIEEVSKELGRGTGGHVHQTIKNAELLRKFGIQIKLNTVVTNKTWKEDMTWILREIKPVRWKVFKMLLISGENDDAEFLSITDDQFKHFIDIHSDYNPVAEDNDGMTDSYVMIDPEGRFYNNTNGKLQHGPPILNVGLRRAFAMSNFDLDKFEDRGGRYEW